MLLQRFKVRWMQKKKAFLLYDPEDFTEEATQVRTCSGIKAWDAEVQGVGLRE